MSDVTGQCVRCDRALCQMCQGAVSDVTARCVRCVRCDCELCQMCQM